MNLLETLQTFGVLYGSRALGVDTDKSDYDYAILLEHIRPVYSLEDIDSPRRYFKYLPEDGAYGILYKVPLPNNEVTDILILNDEDDLQVVRDAISDLQRVPTYLLQDKATRVTLYQTALKEYGWSDNTFIEPRRPRLVDLNINSPFDEAHDTNAATMQTRLRNSLIRAVEFQDTLRISNHWAYPPTIGTQFGIMPVQAT